MRTTTTVAPLRPAVRKTSRTASGSVPAEPSASTAAAVVSSVGRSSAAAGSTPPASGAAAAAATMSAPVDPAGRAAVTSAEASASALTAAMISFAVACVAPPSSDWMTMAWSATTRVTARLAPETCVTATVIPLPALPTASAARAKAEFPAPIVSDAAAPAASGAEPTRPTTDDVPTPSGGRGLGMDLTSMPWRSTFAMRPQYAGRGWRFGPKGRAGYYPPAATGGPFGRALRPGPLRAGAEAVRAVTRA